MKSATRPNNPAARSNGAGSVRSRVPVANTRGSEAPVLSRDREGAVVTSKVRQHTGARKARVALRVQPRASRERLSEASGTEWKLAITAPPVDGKANAACIEFFARGLRVPKSAVTIVAGETSRRKRIEIEGVMQETLDAFLRNEAQ